MSSASAARRLAQAIARSGRRSLHTSSAAQGGGGHGHGGYEDYLHAPHMYNIKAMKARKLKFGLGVGAVVVTGTAIPFIAAEWSHMKARG